MVKAYTEAQVLAAWDRTFAKTYTTPSSLMRGDFLGELHKGDPLLRREEGMLFTKQELLHVAATGHEKVMIHGVFALLGMDMANEAALLAQARDARLGELMEIVVRRAKLEERFTIGRTYRDADGRLFRYTAGGFRQYVLVDIIVEPRRPLKEI